MGDKKALPIHIVSSTDSYEFDHLIESLSRSSIIGLDAEWKPIRGQQIGFPTVSLLQLACQLRPNFISDSQNSLVFLLDLYSLPLSSIWPLLLHVFVSPDILKLGFKFKQDLAYVSSTFSSHGSTPDFDKVEPYMDITNIYHFLQHKQLGKKTPKENKSLATICKEVLGISLSKELQCSDWSQRPLTEAQKKYAASDAHCLLKIFDLFLVTVAKEGNLISNAAKPHSSNDSLGLRVILESSTAGDKLTRLKFEAQVIIWAMASSEYYQRITQGERVVSKTQSINTMPMDELLMRVVRKYGDKILLKEADKKPKFSKRKGKRRPSAVGIYREKQLDSNCDWQGPPPWDLSLGGNGCPKFLCDVMIEGLAKHLRCVGIDAAVPYSRKPEPRELIHQAHKEQRVLLTRDAKLLRHQYTIKNQIYRVKSLIKNEQLLEVIETFQLQICEDQLMSRCTKCNGRFIQKPLTTEEAIEAAKGFQRIPSCLFNQHLEFWQCRDCNQLYWEGTQYHNAVQKFIDVCKLSAYAPEST